MIRRNSRAWLSLRHIRNRANLMSHGVRNVHPTSYIHSSAQVAKDLVTEEFVFVGPGSQIDPGVSIGRYTMLASHVAVVGDDHVTNIPCKPMQFSGRPDQTRTYIGRDVWVGYRAIIRRGVTIGDGAIVGANSVVVQDVAPYAVVAGSPARPRRMRFENLDDRERHSRMLSGPLQSPEFTEPLSAPVEDDHAP